MEPLLKEERQQQIIRVLQENKKVTVTDLSQQFGISEVTVRRDLHDMAINGQLVRTHRGALVAAAHPPEPPIIQRMSLSQQAKEAIAMASVALVNEGDSIFIGSGSTMTFFAHCLENIGRITITTNAINIATELAARDTHHAVIVIGGIIRAPELSLLGHIAEQTLNELRINKIFMGVQALSLDGGWTTDHLPEVATTRKILGMSQDCIILADHTKFGRMAAAFIAPISQLSTLVTDSQADPQFIQQLQARGIRVILAREFPTRSEKETDLFGKMEAVS